MSKLNIDNTRSDKVIEILKLKGFDDMAIQQIINGEYVDFSDENEVNEEFSLNTSFSRVFEELRNDYTLEELEERGVKNTEIEKFKEKLFKLGLSVEEAKAINQYSNGSNMILGIKKGISKGEINNGIYNELDKKLQERGVKLEDVEKVKEFIKTIDYAKPLHDIFDEVRGFLEIANLNKSVNPSINTTIKSLRYLQHIDETISLLDSALSKSRLPKPMTLYRGMKISGDIDMHKLSDNTGYTSTSPLYDSSFAKYPDYDVVLELYVPKGTQGVYITEFSDYDTSEQEILLNSNDIVFYDFNSGVIDRNGNEKKIIKGIVVSKDFSCYERSQQEERTNAEFSNLESEITGSKNRGDYEKRLKVSAKAWIDNVKRAVNTFRGNIER